MRDMFLQVARLNEGSATRSSMRAQNPEIGTLGGYLLGQEMATEILPVLRPRVVAFNAGVRSVEVQGVGSYIVPKATVAPQAYRPGMNEAVPESDGQFDVVIANMRPIASNIRIPRQMLLSQAVAAEEHLRNEMVKSISLKIDQEIFIGAGKATATDPGAQILGIERVLQTNPTYASTNVVTLAANGRKPVLQDLEDALTVLASNDVEQSDEWGWVFHPRVEGVFRSITDTTGQPLLRGNYGEREYERLLGYRKHMSTQIPINRTTGSNNNTSLIFAGRFDFAQYVMSNQIEIIVDEYSQSRNLQVMFTAYTFSDFIVDYPQAFYLINGVTF
jgi:HK97 family phage major capsid protein